MIEKIHQEVSERQTREGARRIQFLNQRTGVRTTHFVEGDFVLVEAPEKKRRHKLMADRRGPRRVVRIESDSLYEIENIP